MSPEQIKALRLRLGLSVERFAELIGSTRATVHNWEQGRVTPPGPAVRLLELLRDGLVTAGNLAGYVDR